MFLWTVCAHGNTNLITGPVTSNATWSGTNLIQGTVVIQSNVVVSISPGTLMLMNTNAVLRVSGQLLADGTTNRPISFTRATTAARWRQILFTRAASSRFRNCIFEFANSVGDHQAYYDNDCNTNTLPLANRTNYTEAIVVLGTHLDLEGCTFRNLPDTSAGAAGDALAFIADDPVNSGNTSGHIWNSQFLNIGQGIHTRFSYVLIENNLFNGKRGDNDHVDMYGESLPPPLLRNNLFFPGHEDAINPTRCSAIIINNVIGGSDDHGIVLRDKCSPIVMNNLVYNCANACIAVQNQCDALIVNNTLRNSARGIRFFDHFDRHGTPYCLFPGSGRATIINNIIWDCTTSFELTDSPDGHSYAAVSYCNVEGGQATASVSANSTLLWSLGNMNADPLFVNLAANNFRLRAGSPCIDTGTNVIALINNDYDGIPRPLDGNDDSTAAFDIGAHEFLLATADSNGDGIPDGWTWSYGLNPTDPGVASGNPDQDPHTTFQEWIADTNPQDAASYFRIASILSGASNTVYFLSSSNRHYSLFHSSQLPPTWSMIVDKAGQGGMDTLSHTNGANQGFYRIRVDLLP